MDGKHYRFLSQAEFEKLKSSGGFLESATVFGHRYGTPRAAIEAGIAGGETMLLDIDVQGARQLREKGVEGIYIFVTPPSLEVLEERLRGRRTEDPDALRRRLDGARREIEARGEYDVVVVNDELERVTAEVREAILAGQRS